MDKSRRQKDYSYETFSGLFLLTIYLFYLMRTNGMTAFLRHKLFILTKETKDKIGSTSYNIGAAFCNSGWTASSELNIFRQLLRISKAENHWMLLLLKAVKRCTSIYWTRVHVWHTLEFPPTLHHAIFSSLQGAQNPETKPTLQRDKNASAQPNHPGCHTLLTDWNKFISEKPASTTKLYIWQISPKHFVYEQWAIWRIHQETQRGKEASFKESGSASRHWHFYP